MLHTAVPPPRSRRMIISPIYRKAASALDIMGGKE
jgi:hypothetical protein